jgi:excinuclease ABC subunit A
MDQKNISIRQARVHNLKSVSLDIPKNSLTVITGPSGSGKSSLAFDTIYVEGQRRYIESLSSYARQFLGQFQPPDVESITGLSPAIAIDQKTSSKNPRSTVGTITEIYDYMRVLYARVGEMRHPKTGEPVSRHTPPQITQALLGLGEGKKVYLLASSAPGGDIKKELKKFAALGFSRVRIDKGEVTPIEDVKEASLKKAKNLEVVVDRFVIRADSESRVTGSVEQTLKLGGGILRALIDDKKEVFYSENNTSPDGEIFPDLEPRLFSFNSPVGACVRCNGLGESKTFDLDQILTDENLPLLEGAMRPLSKRNSFLYKMVESMAIAEKVDLDKPYKKLPKKFLDILINGTDKVYTYSFTSENSHFEFSKAFPGIVAWLEKKYVESSSDRVRADLEEYMDVRVCPDCKGERLNPVALSTFVSDQNIIGLCNLSVENLSHFFLKLKLPGDRGIIAEKLLHEINARLKFLVGVGLGYLTLNRPAMTLSGGESQRIRLATQIGSALTGVLYVLDEPSIGLHQRDNSRLIKSLKDLRDIGNTVLVVEHDEETMLEADHIIDMGPGSGEHGGEVVANFPREKFLKDKKSLTARYLRGEEKIEIPKKRRSLEKKIVLKGAKKNNLKGLNVEIPLGGLTCITGVSGSGKSTLIHEILVPACKAILSKESRPSRNAPFQSITGLDAINSVIELDQSPIGRTPHSNPATYTGLFDDIRTLFSKTPESQIRGYKPGRFSFNVKGGRCEDCEGNGVKKIEMHFLPDVYITCSSCNGRRYNTETLSVLYKGKNISDILKMSIEEGAEFFKNHTSIHHTLSTLVGVGLGYMRLGQPATTLSGGEAQRLKLSRELSKRPRGHCLYVLDEPTTGLHFQDIRILLIALTKLIDQGNSMLIIEHNLDVIKCADYLIDLGPEGGDKGGTLVAAGTPEEVARVKTSHTGHYLKKVLG